MNKTMLQIKKANYINELVNAINAEIEDIVKSSSELEFKLELQSLIRREVATFKKELMSHW